MPIINNHTESQLLLTFSLSILNNQILNLEMYHRNFYGKREKPSENRIIERAVKRLIDSNLDSDYDEKL